MWSKIFRLRRTHLSGIIYNNFIPAPPKPLKTFNYKIRSANGHVQEVYCYSEWIRVQKTVLYISIHSAICLAQTLHRASSKRIYLDSAIWHFLFRRVRKEKKKKKKTLLASSCTSGCSSVRPRGTAHLPRTSFCEI